MNFPRRFLLSLALMAITCGARAQWNGQGEFGLVISRGNAKTETGNIKFSFSGEHGGWRHLWNVRALYGHSNKQTAAERWETFFQSELKLNGNAFAFGSLRFEQDHFSGFAYQATASTGFGYDFIDTDKVKLSGSLGGGYRKLMSQELVRDAADNVISRIDGEVTEDAVGKAGLLYKHKLTRTTLLTNSLLVESGTENTLTQNDLGVQVSMTERLALGFGYSVRHNANPPEGQTKTDQLTTVNLVYTLQ